MTTPDSYRQKVYDSYLTSAGVSHADLGANYSIRLPYLQYLVRNFFPTDRTVRTVDFGCGYGALIKCARSMGYTNVTGIDDSAEQVAAAKAFGVDGVSAGNIFTIVKSISDASVDMIITIDVLEHMRKDELVSYVLEMQRILKPAGSWLIHVPNAEGPLGPSIFFADFTHETMFTRSSLRQLLATAGFSKVQTFEDKPIAHGFLSTVRRIFWEIIRLRWRFLVAVETGNLDKSRIYSQCMLALVRK